MSRFLTTTTSGWRTTYAHLELLNARPDLDAAMGQTTIVDQAGTLLSSSSLTGLPDAHNAFEMFLNHWPHIGSLVARMSVRDTVGYFDEREAFSQGEDWDWQLRLALRRRVGFVPALSSSCRVRPPGRGNEDAANAFRIRINRHIFWTNVRRAYGCRPPLLSVARARLRYDGIYADTSSRAPLLTSRSENTAQHGGPWPRAHEFRRCMEAGPSWHGPGCGRWHAIWCCDEKPTGGMGPT